MRFSDKRNVPRHERAQPTWRLLGSDSPKLPPTRRHVAHPSPPPGSRQAGCGRPAHHQFRVGLVPCAGFESRSARDLLGLFRCVPDR